MSYATEAQMQVAAGGAVKLVEFFDWDNDGAVDAAVIAQCQVEVDAIIDSYVSTRYAAPVENPSAAFQAIAASEYVFWAQQKRGMVSQEAKDSHEERVAWLVKLSKGQVQPSDPTPAKSSAVKSAWVDRGENDVSRTNLEGFT
jgi:phage gp36-like protein